jgi:L-amino acid N-acyltransferase YncA
VLVRDATVADLPAISAIYNATIPTTTAAWTERPETLEERTAWFQRQRERGFATLVADDAGTVVGFSAFGDFRDTTKWPGYDPVVELTIHVAESHWRRGVGRALLSELIARAHALGKTQIVAGIDGANEVSIRLHERLGFREVGRLPAIGTKFGRPLDLVLMQRLSAPG